MTQISVELPDEFVAAIGSEDAAKELILAATVSELVRRGLISSETAEAWLGESLADWLRLAVAGGSFDFWKDPAEDIYTAQNGQEL